MMAEPQELILETDIPPAELRAAVAAHSEQCRRAAYHEGGHSLWLILTGRRVFGAALCWEKIGDLWNPWGGVTIIAEPCDDPESGQAEREDFAAGICAETIEFPIQSPLDPADDSGCYWRAVWAWDFKDLTKFHEDEGCSPAEAERAGLEDIEKLRPVLQTHWAAVDGIAMALLEKGSVNGPEIEEIALDALPANVAMELRRKLENELTEGST